MHLGDAEHLALRVSHRPRGTDCSEEPRKDCTAELSALPCGREEVGLRC